MRGRVEDQGAMFYSFDLEERIPASHPLRKIKARVDREMHCLSPHFDLAYSKIGRPSIPVEQLIKATLLQALYSVRSERQLCEQIAYNMLFQWFLGLLPDKAVWDHSTFSVNRERMAKHGLMEKFFAGSVMQAIELEAASGEHFSVDGSLIAAWASMKSVRPKDEPKDKDGDGDSNQWANWHGEKRTNETHESKTDPEARLARKGNGQSALLAHSMHLLMENRNGLAMGIVVAEANGTSERQTALEMLREIKRRFKLRVKTVGADKGYDDGPFLDEMERKLKIVPHVPTREGAIVSHDAPAEARKRARKRQGNKGYSLSQRCRKRIEEIFGWFKDVGGLRKTKFIGRWKIQLQAYAVAAAYNFLRLVNLEANTA
jgi:transposase